MANTLHWSCGGTASNVTVVQVLWGTPTETGSVGSATENSGGVDEIYVDGKLDNTTYIGNGTIDFYLSYMQA